MYFDFKYFSDILNKKVSVTVDVEMVFNSDPSVGKVGTNFKEHRVSMINDGTLVHYTTFDSDTDKILEQLSPEIDTQVLKRASIICQQYEDQ